MTMLKIFADNLPTIGSKYRKKKIIILICIIEFLSNLIQNKNSFGLIDKAFSFINFIIFYSPKRILHLKFKKEIITQEC